MARLALAKSYRYHIGIDCLQLLKLPNIPGLLNLILFFGLLQIIYEFYTVKEQLHPEDCNTSDGNMKFLREYFKNYEKETQMEEFLGNF
jgi:hypothetical protein